MHGFGPTIFLLGTQGNRSVRSPSEMAVFHFDALPHVQTIRQPLADRLASAALVIIPGWLRRAWQRRAQERYFAVACARLKDTSPHLLDDIGVDEIRIEARVRISVPDEDVSVLVRGASVERAARKFLVRLENLQIGPNGTPQFGH